MKRNPPSLAGVVPLEHAELFGDELRRMFPARDVRMLIPLDCSCAELWVTPGIGGTRLARWQRRFTDLRAALEEPSLES